MTIEELTRKLCECHDELKKMGAFGSDLFDGRKGCDVSVHTRNEYLPEGKAEYDTSVYTDKVVKSVVVGNVRFFAIISQDEAKDEGIYWGALV